VILDKILLLDWTLPREGARSRIDIIGIQHQALQHLLLPPSLLPPLLLKIVAKKKMRSGGRGTSDMNIGRFKT
jgi:hypothetical protein